VREIVVDHHFAFAPFVSLLRAFHNNHKQRFRLRIETHHATQKEEERLQGQAQDKQG
jgi:hypothetical protein